MTKFALTILFAIAIAAIIIGAMHQSLPLLVVSIAASLTIITVAVYAGGWRVLIPGRQ